ncbi:uncharacterized protein [Salvelinus sp. IW2-2015]|uniref:uncharacterized protein n=1 Tax=Salvelinus sp. IW2-2015 TaxID=2691554 RepID=UPI0038D41455
MNKDECLDDMMTSLNNSTTQLSNMELDLPHYLLIGVSLLTVLVSIVLGTLWLKKYRSLKRTIRDLRGGRPLGNVLSTPDSPFLSPASPSPPPVTLTTEKLGKKDPEEQTSLQRNNNRAVTNRLLWRPPQQVPRFTKSDLSLLQLIKAGKEGVFYKARMTRGTCKGHGMFTCKITKEGVTPKRIEVEVSIMRKLVHHKNVLQLLDWNTTEGKNRQHLQLLDWNTTEGKNRQHATSNCWTGTPLRLRTDSTSNCWTGEPLRVRTDSTSSCWTGTPLRLRTDSTSNCWTENH